MKKLPLLLATLLGSSMVLSACATASLLDSAKSEPAKQYTTNVLSENVIAVGYPNEPIKGYEHAMLLAGKNYSFIVQPIASYNTPQNLFQTLFAQVDLNALYIDTRPTISTIKTKTQAKSNTLSLDISSSDSKQVKEVPVDVDFLFIKPTKMLKANEQGQMEELGFKCETAAIDEQNNLICQQRVQTAITVASAVQNIDNLNYKLKQPLTVDFNYQGETRGSNKEWLRLFTPVAIAVDIVTLPVQALAVGVAGAVVLGSLAKYGYQ